jgi:hypothetical protein
MSKNIGGVPVIFPEPPRQCELCSKVEECRPYGPRGEQVCFDCAMKDEAAAKRQMMRALFRQNIQ